MEDSFGTVVEFAVAIAGFSAVAIALSHDRGAMAPLDRFRALNLLSCALGPAFGASFVLIGRAFGVEASTLWSGVSAGVLLVVLVCTGIPIYLARQLSPSERRGLSPLLWVLCVGGNGVLATILVVNGAGLLGAPNPGPIMVSLIWLLLFSAILFVRILVDRPE